MILQSIVYVIVNLIEDNYSDSKIKMNLSYLAMIYFLWYI